jgi:hypothetical protein
MRGSFASRANSRVKMDETELGAGELEEEEELIPGELEEEQELVPGELEADLVDETVAWSQLAW